MAMVVENQQPVAQLVVPEAPPPLPPPPQAYKHHCKVCKKGFVCGRALGGHMRAHGVNDDDDEEALDDDDAAGSCDDSTEAATTSNKRMSYALRDNPGRAKSCRVCENCGMEFTSWKSLLDHGRCRCNYDEEEDSVMIRSPPLRDTNDDDGEEVETDQALATAGWSKGKRTRRGNKLMEVAENGSETEATTTSHSREEEDLANCLVMLSSSSRSVQPPPAVLDADHESHAPATSKDVDVERNSRVVLVPQPISVMALDNMTMVPPELKLLAPPQVVVSVSSQPTAPRGLFECKACKKVFTSHQALGGHRASHKKVKGCYAAKLDSNQQPSVSSSAAAPNESIMANNNADGNPMNSADSSAAVVMATATAAIAPETTAATTQLDEPPAGSAPPVVKKKGKVHECSICHRVFMSGQALGGHKRCHWLTTGSAVDPTTTTTLQHHPVIPQDHHLMRAAVCQQLTLGRPPMFDAAAAHHPTAILDLNKPPPSS
ncbi:hypothetical protein PR202_gb09274 [Eleusine coracana subsp. coracana]|uniref:C2H2-type domain-containing protein n=1 Tax=Eleusine coracana subsp. coracana TaxID=191504 RepID=A0AAV5EGQ8_ELECO|nr:hypothetical protein PR202_gb09274 [Eleusine coracana subsp. coracana]